ncbi:hypothetical protein AGABI2DRAFT_193710 [Agaricus bisporus var. bisporus H97]|uniref:hypothetical protein n=1 Tax=Agaricus bisporus var. bisporus (strain H97 / ATCC MYA-4626 / FGSC 10389) TaxID=936046 RepID=UPI00029F740D|nr:hypothetical protein AGABI2DRAFT_193710 [Agaricus bisporus var. bisporus H97]EKV45783.1 hypothetical protein AGABI2DRAFT_193710 [Agaricus bisporus var. bisporus H97]
MLCAGLGEILTLPLLQFCLGISIDLFFHLCIRCRQRRVDYSRRLLWIWSEPRQNSPLDIFAER